MFRASAIAALVVLATLAAWGLWLSKAGGSFPKPLEIGSEIPDFTLLSRDGVAYTLSRSFDRRAVMIVADDFKSAVSHDLLPRLRSLSTHYPQADIWRIDPGGAENRDFKKDVPALMDPSQVVIRKLGLTRLSEAVVIDPRDWRLVYRGDFDGALDSVEKLHRGEKVSPSEKQAEGERLALVSEKMPSYQKDIAPVLQRACLACHSEAHTVKITTLEEIRAIAPHIIKELLLDRMPPFSSDPAFGPFWNEASISSAEKRKLMVWLEAGAPATGKDSAKVMEDIPVPLEKIMPKYAQRVFTAETEVTDIPAGGDLEYQYFQLGEKASSNLWINGIKVESDVPGSLRQARVYISRSSLPTLIHKASVIHFPDRCYDATLYLLGAFDDAVQNDPYFMRLPIRLSVGSQPAMTLFARDLPAYVPKGYHLILEVIRYGASRPVPQKTKVEFFGTTRADGRNILRGTMFRTREMRIPPGVKSHFERTATFKHNQKPIGIMAVSFHMHRLGRSARLVEIPPNGKERTIASLPNFHYGLQSHKSIVPIKPIRVAADSVIQAVCEFDSSEANKSAPHTLNPTFVGITKSGTEMCNVGLQFYYEK
jgi:hypothetical protein